MNSYYCKKTEIEYKIPDHWSSRDICAACIHLSDCQEDNDIGTLKDIVDKFAQVAINFSEFIKPLSALSEKHKQELLKVNVNDP